jgi:hypothetical protein
VSPARGIAPLDLVAFVRAGVTVVNGILVERSGEAAR